ncbi:pancreatic triacylglycerol lipase-like [Sturnira hondurensis]|uniref:pancreatic triacylglycerol lipase-like n=1 Tax=Sturnira hondurensis TaxID=192404 RepID=UPI00187AE7DE|nr:pancreatic triacylglycerol lipase-like [Sturnira hondurensis]
MTVMKTGECAGTLIDSDTMQLVTLGLDPAEPCFEGTPELVRLDASDAQFVDVIHTDIAPLIPNMGFGTSQISGHLDFFPNGGIHMPGCKRNTFSQLVSVDGIWEGICHFVACNHLRSYEYYNHSILHPEGFAGFPCASYNAFSENTCYPCPSGGCPQMGHYADRFPGKTREVGQTFYLNTGATVGDFSRWRYRVTVTLSGKKVRGHVLVSLFGDQGNSEQYEVFHGVLQPESVHSSDIDSDVDVGDLQKVEFLWHKSLIISLTRPEVGASQITVERNDGKTEYNFCSQSTVRDNVLLTLTPC